jgi:hypothetical protein
MRIALMFASLVIFPGQLIEAHGSEHGVNQRPPTEEPLPFQLEVSTRKRRN